MNNTSNKIVEDNQRFLTVNRPIYIELPNEKGNQDGNDNASKPA